MRNLRVLMIRTDAGVFDPRILKESKCLSGSGYDVRVFAWDRRSEFPSEERINNATFRRSRIPGPYGSKLLLLVLPLFWLRTIVEAWRFRPNIVHACDLDGLIPALCSKMLWGHPVIYDVFDMFGEKITGLPRFVRKIIRSFDRGLMRFADGIIVTDERRKHYVNAAVVRRLEVVMNVPPDVAADRSSSADRQVRVCYAGSIHETRGLHIIAEAVHGLEGVETIFAGWIPRTVDENYLAGQRQIKYVGKLPYEESLKLMAESDIILALYDPSLPVNAEASSNKVYEAMACSRPVITNVENAMAEVVRREDSGVLIPYGSVDALRQAIGKLRDDPGLRKSLGSHGRQAFERSYSWSVMEPRLLSLYHDVLDPGDGPARERQLGGTKA